MKFQKKYPSYKSGYQVVKVGHELYYELYGNPDGKPVVFLHGGPGGGFNEKDERFFDPKKWNVLLFDQRGAGRSKPFGSREHNTTWDLVNDINLLTEKFNLKHFLLFGGSWGSTLALVYAITYPEKVTGLVLRGIFLGTDEEQEYVYQFMKYLRPAVWERFMKLVPINEHKNVIAYYFQMMQSPDKNIANKYAFEWAYFESSLLKMRPRKNLERLVASDDSYKALSPLEIHYFINKCFLKPNFILEHASQLKKIPTAIIHGTFDLVCPPSSAYKLHKALPGSTLYMVHGGHSGSEKAIEKKLIEELQKHYVE